MTADLGDDPVRQIAIASAHAYDNLLAVILGHAEILLGSLPDGDRRRADVDAIVIAARRAIRINDRLRTIGRTGPPDGEPHEHADPLLHMTVAALDRSLAVDHDARQHR